MHCERITELLSAALDDELSQQEAVELKKHLEVCPDCRELEAQLAALREPLFNMEELQAPEGFASGVMERIRMAEEKKAKVIPFFRRPQVRALAGLAACAVLCVGLMKPELFSGMGADNAAAEIAQETTAAAAAAPAAPLVPAGYTAAENGNFPEPTTKAYTERAKEEAGHDAGAAAAVDATCRFVFTNDQYLPVTYGSTPEAPLARILGSEKSLDDFLAQFPEDDLSDLAGKYTADFFETGRLLAIVLEENSGSVRHTIDPQGVEGETVTVLRQVPEAGTCDMAAWLILAEMDARFEDGHTFIVIFG